MKNIFKSLFNFAPVNQINLNNTKIETSVKRLEKDFYGGNIEQAYEDLESLLSENNSNPVIKYQLLVKKTSFLFALRQNEEALELLKYIEKEYSKFLDVNFEELKLIRLSIEGDEKAFFELVNKIRIENPKPADIEKFQLMFYLNSNNISKAKETFETIDDKLKSTKDISLMGGQIYSLLDDHPIADKYYQIALTCNISFLEKSSIYAFYGTNIINSHMYGSKLDDGYKQALIDYKQSLENILKYEKYFNISYIENLKNNYLAILVIVGEKEEFIEFYKKALSIEIIFINYYIDYCRLSEIPINHKLIQERIKEKQSELIFRYCSLLQKLDDDAKIILSFLEENNNYIIENQYIFLFYIQAKIAFDETTDSKYKDVLASEKYENIEFLIAYLLMIEQKDCTKKDIEKLIEFANNELQIRQRIFESLDLLMKFGYRKEYIDLAIDKQKEFSNVILKTLVLCQNDKELHIQEFDYFVEKIEKKDSNIKVEIADIYAKFNAYKKSLEYFYLLFKDGNRDTTLLLKMLEVSFNHFRRTNGKLEEKKEKQIYDILIAKKDDLDLWEIIYLFQYSIEVLKDTKQILPTLNQLLLSKNINSLEQDIKVELSNLFTQTTIGMHRNYEQLFIYEENICYVKDGETFFRGYETIDENIYNFGLRVVDDNKFFSFKNNPSYVKESMFHRIVGPFAYRVDNPNMIPLEIDMSSDNPLQELSHKIKELFGDDRELFEKYTREEFYGLYSLAGEEYANYFTLIPYLLNHENYRLNSLKPSFMIDKKKILTISSIVFLNYLGYLEQVLKMDNIVIQQTTVNWLQKYIENFDSTKRPREFSYLDEEESKFIPHTQKIEDEALEFKNMLIKLVNKLIFFEIIDDTNENLPLAEAYKLAKHMGEQEYQALSYCINHNYQIVSENNVFEILFDTFGYNKLFLTNSFSLFASFLNPKDVFSLQRKLNDLKYQYVSNCPKMDSILDALYFDDFPKVLNGQVRFLFKIWHEYGCLNDLINSYINRYKVLYPKLVLPVEDTFSRNMEYLLKKLDISDIL